MGIQIIDLFSGIGGFSLALKKISTTVCYCDIDPICRQVLMKNMNKEKLDKAPIYEDVSKLPLNQIRKLKPTMVTGGFPCQDISVANPNGEGLSGARSGLFKHILDVVDKCPSISIVFMENSSNIVNSGYDYISDEFKKRGFMIKYTLINASDVGALHKRLRWYCLCVKTSYKKTLPLIPKEEIKFNWKCYSKYEYVLPVTSVQHKKQQVLRNAMLGNSIVPQCCRHAWNTLVSGMYGMYGMPGMRKLSGMPQDNEYVPCKAIKKREVLKLVLSDGVKTITKPAWATPCHTFWNIYSHLTERGSRVLSNQSYYYTKSSVPSKDKKAYYTKYTTNPLFVESLMGYSKNWTKL